MESTSWCSDEFSEADFGDKRLSSRLVKLVDKLSEQPTNPINQSCQSWSETKAAYRFLKNEKVNCAEICKSHSLRTKERARQYDVIISASDKSFFNYDGHKKTDGLGPIGKIQKHCSQGLVMHTAFAVTTTGLPLGILDQKIWAREKKLKQKKDHWRKPIDQKESNTWLLSLKKTTDLMADMKTKVVTVADREADIYEYIVYGNKIGANFIVRAAWSRSIVNDNNESLGHLWDYMATKQCAGLVEVVVPEAKNQIARTATVEILFQK